MALVAEVRHVMGVGRQGREAPRLASPPASQVRPRVSVVVPCYDYGHLLPLCVRSILGQSGVDVDVVIVDDASPDGSGRVAERLAAGEDRIRVLHHEHNAGHIATYNDGLRMAEGEYVVLLSADDALAPGALQRATSLMAHHAAVGFVYGAVRTFSDTPPDPVAVEGHESPAWYAVWQGGDWLERRCRLMTNCVISPEVVMRRAVYEQVGPYDPRLPHTGDLAMWMKAAAVADVGYVGGPPAAYYRIHETNMHTSRFHSGEVEGMLIDLVQRRLTLEVVFGSAPATPATLSNAARLHDLGRRALAAEALGLAARSYTWGLSTEWPVDELVGFAATTWPGYRSLWQFRALRRRQAVGRRLSHKCPPFLATELVLRARLRHRRWAEARVGA